VLLCWAVPVVLPRVVVSSAGSPGSLKVQWDALTPDQARGIITRHQLIYRRHGSLTQHTIDLPATAYEHVIDGTTRLLILLPFIGCCFASSLLDISPPAVLEG